MCDSSGNDYGIFFCKKCGRRTERTTIPQKEICPNCLKKNNRRKGT